MADPIPPDDQASVEEQLAEAYLDAAVDSAASKGKPQDALAVRVRIFRK
jgi:hypothetical protein